MNGRLFLICVLCLSSHSLAAPREPAELTELKKQVEELRADFDAARDELRKLDEELNRARGEVEMDPAVAQAYKTWRAEKQAVGQEKAAVKREAYRVKQEAAELERLAFMREKKSREAAQAVAEAERAARHTPPVYIARNPYHPAPAYLYAAPLYPYGYPYYIGGFPRYYSDGVFRPYPRRPYSPFIVRMDFRFDD